MTAETQNLVWSVLPKEFKEEVKKLYIKFYNEKPPSDCSYGYLGLLIKLFGIHNLTSDAEGEEAASKEPKPANPKYHIGQRVKFKSQTNEYRIAAVIKREEDDEYRYRLVGCNHLLKESRLEPITKK